MTDEAIARNRLLRWRRDPVAFVREQFHAEPDKWQREVLEAAGNESIDRIAMKACKGPGKTCVLAWLIWWFLAVHPEAKIAATSITEDNLRDNLWAELSKWQTRSPFLLAAFQWSTTRIVNRARPANWFATARTWPKTADPQRQADTLAGLHADYILFVLDESGGIPQAVMATAEAVLASGKRALIVQAGNPTHLEGPLYRACSTDRALWTVITITGDPDNPARSPRIKIEWARQQIKTYGRDNPWVMVNVLGEFPPSSINALLGINDVERAIGRVLRPEAYSWAQKRIGVDVARYGDDRTVLFPRQGLMAFQPVIMRHERDTAVSVDIANRVMLAKSRWTSEVELFDATGGWAAGAVDVMRSHGLSPMNVQFAGKATDPRFYNKRAEMWWKMAEWVKGGGKIPNIPELVPELTVPTYTFEKGKLRIEEKDQIKERLGASPDIADALALTFGMVELPSQLSVGPASNTRRAVRLDDMIDDDGLALRTRSMSARVRRLDEVDETI